MIVQRVHETIGRSGILRRTAADAGDAHGKLLPLGFGDLHDADFVQSGVVKVVCIHETLMDSKVESFQRQAMTTELASPCI